MDNDVLEYLQIQNIAGTKCISVWGNKIDSLTDLPDLPELREVRML